MAGDDSLKAGGGGIKIETGQIVKNVESRLFDAHDLSARQRPGPGTGVDVSSHGDHWRDRLQDVENLPVSYVSGVDDLAAALQFLERLLPEEAVSVGDDADSLGH